MGATATVVAEFFAATAPEAAAASATAATASAAADAAGIAYAAGTTSGLGYTAAEIGLAGDGAAGFMSQLGKTAGQAAAGAVGSGVVTSMLAPKPKVASPTAMPDPLAQEAARKKALVDRMTASGRASTVLTDSGSGSGSLGG